MTRDTFVEDLRAALAQGETDQAYLNSWAQLRSKHLLATISPESVESIGYTYSAPQLVRRTTGTLQRAMRLAESRALAPDTSEGLRRAAEVFEYLADLDEGASRDTSLLLSAALYQLAGYAANSICISRQIAATSLPSTLTFDVGTRLLDQGLKLALERRFVRLLREARDAATRLEGSEDTFVDLLRTHDATPEAAIALPAAHLTATAFERLASHALSGASIEPFLDVTEDLRGLLLAAGVADSLLKADILASLGRRVADASVWTELAEQIEQDGVWRRYAVLASRGRGATALEARSGTELWQSQLTALRAGLLSHSNNGLAVRMPTSAGKTRIAELAILGTLTDQRRRQVIYVAPFNALADEIEASMSLLFADLGFRVSSVLGNYDLDELEEDLINSSDLLITTPEKLTFLLRSRPEHFGSVGLLVLDEGHIIDSTDRGISYELLLTKLRQRMPEDAKVLFLSAVIPEDNAADFAEWLCGSRSAISASDWRPARQLVGIFNARRNRITYPLQEQEQGGFVSPFVPRVIEAVEYRDFTFKQRREKMVRFPGPSKGEITAELVLKFSGDGPVVVFTTQPRWAESCARAILKALRLRRQTDGVDIPRPFRDVADRGYPPSSLAIAESWLGPEAEIVGAIREGVGIHHGGLPEAVRRAVENDFRSGLLPVVAATGTLAQGVNLPVKTVLIHTLHQYNQDADEGEDQRISLLDFWNTAGRAGRAGAETEGHIVVVALNDPEDRRARAYLSSERLPVTGRLYDVLQALVEDRLSREEFRAQLDSDLLATLVEETVGSNAEQIFGSLVEGSFVSIQARKFRQDTAPLVDLGSSVIGGIREEVPDTARREVFSLTGLDVGTCIAIEDRIRDEEEEIRRLLTDRGVVPQEIVRKIHAAIADLPAFAPRYDFVGDMDDLIEDWVGQKSMRDITNEHLSSTADMNRFQKDLISDYFGYRLPWGVASFMGIANGILQLEETTSDSVQWLVPMVRHGVATKHAAWAMAVGCPTREFSTQIAESFIEQGGRDTYQEFVRWFANLSAEDFILGMQATPDEARVLVPRAAALVPDGREVTARLRSSVTDYTADVAGLQHGNRWARLPAVTVGDDVDLIRDYGNPYDLNAIAVNHQAGELGYLPRDVARLIAPQMDIGISFRAAVTDVERTSHRRVQVSISSPSREAGL